MPCFFQAKFSVWIKVIFTIVFLFPGIAQSENIIITNQAIYTFKGNQWSYLTVSDSSVSIKEIIKYYKSNRFTEVNASVYNGGIPEKYYWFHFSITNKDTADVNLYIDIESPRLNYLRLFEYDRQIAKSLAQTGDFFPFEKRPIEHKNFVINSVLKRNKTKDYFLLVNQIGHAFILPIKIFKGSAFQTYTSRSYLTDGITYGILLFVAIFSLILFISTRHMLYIYYTFYIISALLWMLSYFGLGYEYLWSKYPFICTVSSPFLASINLFFNIRICQLLLQLKKTNYFLNKLANILGVSLLVIGAIPWIVNLNQYGYQLNATYLTFFLTVTIGSVLIVLCSTLFNSMKGSIVARFYLVASILKVGSILNLAFLEFGISPALYDLDNFLKIGILIEITLLTYAIAQRYNLYKFKTFQQVIFAQEGERKKIAADLHDTVSNSLIGIHLSLTNLINNQPNLSLETQQHLEKIYLKVRDVQHETRYISHRLTPDYILKNSLVPIIEKYIDDLGAHLAEDKSILPSISFSSNDELISFPEAVKLNIYRIIQELISNTLKHSCASAVEVIFSFTRKELTIVVEDNGIGIHNKDANKSGIGISNIKSRVDILNGKITIQSLVNSIDKNGNKVAGDNMQENSGTLIIIKIPARNINAYQNIYEY
jgi:signal transduction histidine kinase